MLLSDNFKTKDLYVRLSKVSLDSLTAADIYTELQKLKTCDEGNLEAFWYLNQLLKALDMFNTGYKLSKTTLQIPTLQTITTNVADAGNSDIVGNGVIAEVIIHIPTGATGTLTGDGATAVIVGPFNGTIGKVKGTLNLAMSGADGSSLVTVQGYRNEDDN